MQNREKGKAAELTASHFLEKKGLKIIERNWTCRWGEIDLIMKQGEKVIFVEVKSRSSAAYGKGVEAITFSKQQKMLRCALLYSQKHPEVKDIAFAVLSLDGDNSAESIEWFEFPLDGFGKYY